MTTPTALALIDKLRHTPEILEAIRQQLNIEAKNNSPVTDETPRIYKTPNKDRDAEIVAKVHAGTHTRAQIAMEYQLSLPRINQIMQLHPNPNPIRVNPNAERDRLILDDARKKVPRAEIARKHGLSVIRVNQIVGAAPKVKKMTFAERCTEAMRKYDSWEDLTFEDECLVLITKYEPWARQLTQMMIEGATPETLTYDFAPDCTGSDIAWSAQHFEAVSAMMYHFETGIWRR